MKAHIVTIRITPDADQKRMTDEQIKTWVEEALAFTDGEYGDKEVIEIKNDQ